MKTLSNQTMESSSSKRPLNGERNGFSCRAAGRRVTTFKPGAFTGTMNQGYLPLPGGMSLRVETSRSSAKAVLVCIWIFAADHDTVGGVAGQAHGGAVVFIRSEPGADQRPAAGVGEEPATPGQRLQVVSGHLDFLVGFVHPREDIQQSQGDQGAVGRGVGDVSAAGENGLR